MKKMEIKVLIVDDDEFDRKYARDNLQRIGYAQIEEAVDSSGALRKTEEYLPHLIIMDTNMPVMEGYKVCQKIRQEEYGNGIAIIGMSNDPISLEDRWLRAGADLFLYKHQVLSAGNKATLEENIRQALQKYGLNVE